MSVVCAFLAILLCGKFLTGDTKGVKLGLCDDTFFTCKCGAADTVFRLRVKQCSYFRSFKMRCKPCEKATPEDICPMFQRCEQCSLEGKAQCISCPSGKYGNWCEYDCKCTNGASCDRNGKCLCREGFEGSRCEKKRGCDAPRPINKPLDVSLNPPTAPVTAVYSCPQEYEFQGQAISTCLSGNKWSSPPPKCLLKCPLLSAPANSHLKYSGSELIPGITAEVTCYENHRLIGEKTLNCMEDGTWNAPLPKCEELATCPDPGNVLNAQRTAPPKEEMRGGHFVQNSEIRFDCFADFEQIGSNAILCLHDGTWSNELPICVKVSKLVPDCDTSGSDVAAEIGMPVRVLCPPECADKDFRVWGTSIYRDGSSICQAAIHSGKITNSGGLVAVINNGPYTHFTGSDSNNIESEGYAGQDGSFRFDKLPPLINSRGSNACPKGFEKLGNLCVYISQPLRTRSEAEAICQNLGLQLSLPNTKEDQVRLITSLNARGITSVWSGTDSTDMTELVRQNGTSPLRPSDNQCGVATISDLEFVVDNKDCNHPLNYVCQTRSRASSLAFCEDPGEIEYGSSIPIGRIDGVYYVGSSIEYSCPTLHYLKGEDTISCLGNGTWSRPKPTCVKVDACIDPPTPAAGFVTYFPPLKTPNEQRAAVARSGVVGTRMGRLPAGLAVPVPESLPRITTTPEPFTIALPPGTHRIGTRAMYDCESRYYELVGSRTRRCQGQGEWSGRPPTCIPVCGRSDSPRSPFIVNGNASDIGQWPWQAGIARYLPDHQSWFLLCGGSLLNERWILTAAHCVTYAGTTLSIEPDKFQVYVGKYHRKDSKDDDFVQVRKVQEIHIHPDYDPGLFDADIALLQLPSPVQLNSRVQTVCLPTAQTSRENLVEGKKGIVTGWGMNENDTYAETLQQAVLPVVSQAKCEKGYLDSDLPLTVTDNMFCAGFEEGRTDACSGDSGGPMVFLENRKWVLEGIVSWGSPTGCGNPNQYGGFTTVSRFLDWIHLFV